MGFIIGVNVTFAYQRDDRPFAIPSFFIAAWLLERFFQTQIEVVPIALGVATILASIHFLLAGYYAPMQEKSPKMGALMVGSGIAMIILSL